MPSKLVVQDKARQLIREYYTMKKGYISALVFATMFAFLIIFLNEFEDVHLRSPQSVRAAAIQPSSAVTPPTLFHPLARLSSPRSSLIPSLVSHPLPQQQSSPSMVTL